MSKPFPRGALIATLVGNTLEFYDFVTYTFLAIYIGKAFFPTQSSFASLLLSVATFGVGFLTRPIGGVLIGAYADRVGRRPALLLTIVLMSVGTIGLVATPSYATIGVAAPIILVLSRLVQGIALGGEVGPANAVLLEAAPPEKRAIYMSLQSASQGVAIVLAGFAGVITAHTMTAAQLEAWGWRLPMAVGLVLIPVGFYMRRALPETLTEPKHASGGDALRAVWRNHRREVVLLVLMLGGSTVVTYVGSYMTTFAQKTLGMSPSIALLAPIANGASIIVLGPVGGWLCERYGRRPMYVGSRIFTVAVLVPMFVYVVHERTTFSLLTNVILIALASAPAAVAASTVMAEAFPAESRSAGIALTYASAVTIFGATTQFVITWLLELTHDPLAPAYYGIFMTLVSIVAGFYLFRGLRSRAS